MLPLDYFDAYCRDYRAYKDGNWCYEDGCIYRGLTCLFDATGDTRWRDHLLRLCGAQLTGSSGLAGYDPDEFNIDNILSGRALIALYRHTGDRRLLAPTRHLIDQLERHPRIAAGNYWHKKRYPHQVWLDGLYMALPFQVEYALETGNPALIDDALSQIESALDLTRTSLGMHVHGYDESRAQRWADPETGRSPAVWARAMGWLSMAIVDVLALLPHEAKAAGIRSANEEILTAVAALQQPSGLWHQVLTIEDIDGNYEESSASAMYAYAMMRASRLGLVDTASREELAAAGKRALEALLDTRLEPQDGRLQFTGICQVAGLGALSGPYRDGTPSYYFSEPVVSDDAKGVGPLMMACAEAIAAGDTMALKTWACPPAG